MDEKAAGRAAATSRRCGHKAALLMLCLSGVVGSCRAAPREIVISYPDAFAGVGLELTQQGPFPTVVRSLAGSPAALAGFVPGDPIVEVDGASTRGKTLGDVVMRLRGEDGTQVSVTTERQGTRITNVMRRKTLVRSADDYRTNVP